LLQYSELFANIAPVQSYKKHSCGVCVLRESEITWSNCEPPRRTIAPTTFRISEEILTDAGMMFKPLPLALPAPAVHVPNINSSYLSSFLEPEKLQRRVELAVEVLSQYSFDAIAFRGMSGALISPSVAMRMNKTLIMVRKPNDDSHAVRWTGEKVVVEGDSGARSYVIIDDIVSSGATAKAIQEAVKDFAPKAVFVGLLEAGNLKDETVQKYRGERYPLWQRNRF
jgi:adenine/guanine phosphoribosyltransferase-like PRPP-binding protein